MNCPICAMEMVEGGLIADALSIDWYPKAEFEKKWYKALIYKDGKNLGASLGRRIKLPNAHYCSRCNKVVGIFDTFDL